MNYVQIYNDYVKPLKLPIMLISSIYDENDYHQDIMLHTIKKKIKKIGNVQSYINKIAFKLQYRQLKQKLLIP